MHASSWHNSKYDKQQTAAEEFAVIKFVDAAQPGRKDANFSKLQWGQWLIVKAAGDRG